MNKSEMTEIVSLCSALDGQLVSERINSLLSRLRRPPVEEATMTPPAFG